MINKFTGPNRWLSNFYPCQVSYEGLVYPTVEHAFQAAKTLDQSVRISIATLGDPASAKHIGRKLPLREDWEEIKIDVMRTLLRRKFSQQFFKVLLLGTKDTPLEEGNHWGDKFWGTVNGTGQNQLGKLLMEIREELRS